MNYKTGPDAKYPRLRPAPFYCPVPSAKKRPLLGLPATVAVMYLIVSGGPYGLEAALASAGLRITLVLCLLAPFLLSAPVALMAAELTALIPVEGGFYFWVKEAFGPFLGFTEAYLTILYTAVDMAIYPTLFAAYLSFLIPLGAPLKLLVELGVIWLAGLLNIAGVRPAGRASLALALAVMAPFLALAVVGPWHPTSLRAMLSLSGSTPIWAQGGLGDHLSALSAALSVVIWNFCGWENLSVAAAELEQPRRNYLRAVLIVIPLVWAGYLIPLVITAATHSDYSRWATGSFAELGYQVGGWWLGKAIAAGGAVSSFAVFAASLLWVSRLPFVLAFEGYLPRSLARLWAPAQTPSKAIIVCCAVFSCLVPLGFVSLVLLDVLFYMTALALEMGALIRLRTLQPARGGLFHIGGGRGVLYLTAAAPLLVWLLTLGLALTAGANGREFILALVLAGAAAPIYWLCRRVYGGPPPPRPQP
jgi:amino acid transporter